MQIPIDETLDFLVALLHIHSPTGYHHEAIAYVRRQLEALQLPHMSLSLTGKGALVAQLQGTDSALKRGLTAHIDTLGLLVKQINGNGSLKVSPLGGIHWPGIEFENVTIRTHDDRRYRGTVILSNPSTHVNRKAPTEERNADTMEVRIDAKVSTAADVRKLGIEVGDFVFLDPRVELVDTGFIRSRFLDDKLCVAAIYGALLALREQGARPKHDAAILISNYEEVGHGGAAGWPYALDELLAIDMAAVGEGQNSDEFSVTICVKDGGGPYHYEMNQRLRALCAAHNIPHKTDIYVYYSSDGTAYWRAGGDAKVGLIGPGVASSHGYERAHREGLAHTIHLIARYLLD